MSSSDLQEQIVSVLSTMEQNDTETDTSPASVEQASIEEDPKIDETHVSVGQGGNKVEEVIIAVSERFNAPDAEITFKSSDNVLFRIHKDNLVVCSEGFSPPSHCTFDDVVPLTESSHILELLFQFIYPRPPPALDTIPFDVLSILAEAAEKYRVYPAINLCTLRLMKRVSTEHSEYTFAHALKHKNRKLAEATAPFLELSVQERISLDLYHAHSPEWIRYHLQWMQSIKKSLANLPSLCTMHPGACASCVVEVTSRLMETGTLLRNLDYVFGPNSILSSCCQRSTFMKAWRQSLEKLPTFLDIIFSEQKDMLDNTRDIRLQELDAKLTEIFFFPDSNFMAISNDGVTFHLHRQNLTICAANILPLEYDDTHPVALPHTSSTLKLLFRFIYPDPHPDLDGLDFVTLERLLNAAETYNVQSAKAVCEIRLKDVLPTSIKTHTHAVMKCALKMKNYDVVDAVAPLLLSEPMSSVRKLMDIDLFLKWIEYHEPWSEAVKLGQSLYSNRRVHKGIPSFSYKGKSVKSSSSTLLCNMCSKPSSAVDIAILRKLGTGAGSLQSLDDTFDTTLCCCMSAQSDIILWKSTLQKVVEAIPKFSTFL